MPETTQKQTEIANVLFGYAEQIVGDCRDLDAKQLAATDARTAYGTARDTLEVNKKIKLLADIAAVSAKNQWANTDLKGAIKAARQKNFNGYNKTPESLNVFWSDVATCAHPSVRSQFPIIIRACNEVWEAESKLPEDKEHIVQSFGAKRLGALIIRVARDMRKGAGKDPRFPPVVVTKAADVTAYVKARDPKTNAQKAAEKCARIAEQVGELYAEFHYDMLAEVKKYLLEADLGARLVAARDLHNAANEAGQKKAKLVKRNGNGAPKAETPKTEAPKAADILKAATPTPKPAIDVTTVDVDSLMDSAG